MGLCPRMRLGYGNFTSPESPMGYPFHTPLARSAPLFPRPLREEQDRMKYNFCTYTAICLHPFPTHTRSTQEVTHKYGI